MAKNNKIALVTGGSRGLGKDMALRLAQKGIDVVLTFNSQEAEAKSVVAAIEKTGQKAAALQFDAGNLAGEMVVARRQFRRQGAKGHAIGHHACLGQ